ncbi:phosphoesterase PA-phosphatase [Streptomyces abyssalis]|uniref:Phosphoesterase PA-phosphatase n=1 Tax=Streptomyces abyssalis TaxID=933944 RepID=A0A1E7JUX5_9ACTN|nr:phosphatase PAP2 family protein [Streptomyces abyssalis]OEU89277.1 phosphoesterase PA-phosphatase [Streptomyces abyssalis]OEU93751.1 phosphoesterase PA-phosphatase [Streptomyces abyssalis]
MRTDRLLARLEQEPERPSNRDVPRMSRTRKLLFGTTSALYAVIVVAVLIRADLVRLDWQVMLFRPYKQWPEVHEFLDYFVVLGQRGPTAVLVAAWLGWRSWRQRTLRPLLVLGTALLALNVTVGAVKIGLGRLGPHYATTVGSGELFAGGDIFPSGHTANAVVTWGILAYLATTPRARRVLSVVAAFFALGVGATTVYLGTHWVSDVLLGWAAGLLILLGLPWAEPVIAWAEDRIQAWRDRRRTASPGGRRLVPSPLSPVTRQSLLPSRRGLPAEEMAVQDEGQHGETAVIAGRAPASSSSGTGIGAARLYHPAGRQHPLRAERAPVSPQPPVGPRRQYSDRSLPRTAHLGPRGR